MVLDSSSFSPTGEEVKVTRRKDVEADLPESVPVVKINTIWTQVSVS